MGKNHFEEFKFPIENLDDWFVRSAQNKVSVVAGWPEDL